MGSPRKIIYDPALTPIRDSDMWTGWELFSRGTDGKSISYKRPEPDDNHIVTVTSVQIPGRGTIFMFSVADGPNVIHTNFEPLRKIEDVIRLLRPFVDEININFVHRT